MVERLSQTEEVLLQSLSPDELLLEGLGGVAAESLTKLVLVDPKEPQKGWKLVAESDPGIGLN